MKRGYEREIVNYNLRYLRFERPDFLEDDIDTSEKWMKFIGDFAEVKTGAEIYRHASSNTHLHPEV